MICKTKSFCAVAVPVLVNCSEKLQGTLFSTKSLQRCSNSLMFFFLVNLSFSVTPSLSVRHLEPGEKKTPI